MKELSLNILDISKNSVKAGATLTEILLDETDSVLTLTIRDNGCGMKKEMVASVTDPFTTTRTTRSVGMGIPLLKLAAEMTGGSFEIKSKHESEYPDNHGTVVTAVFNKNHIDFTPLGDIPSSITTLIQGSPDTDFLFKHTLTSGQVGVDTRELRKTLGDVPLDTFEVILWIEEYLKEQYEALK
ncbi:MAG: sensor histidine kinase [Clostridia bacterium]|nr:sensor histidine kinase [Clostridia bacterium]